MAKKPVIDKVKTKVKNLLSYNPVASDDNGSIKIRNKILVKYSEKAFEYGKRRYYGTKKIDLTEEDFKVKIILSHENLKLLGSNPINPPIGAKNVIRLIQSESQKEIDTIIIGAKETKIDGKSVYVTKQIYDTINQINKEEGKDKRIRFTNRCVPFLKSDFKIEIEESENKRDYSLLLKELIASKEITQADIISILPQLDTGELNHTVIENQVTKQVKWLIETIEKILEETNLTKPKARELGNKLFGFLKGEISGPEHLMEKILSEYGQYTLFGVPALLNTDKYVVHAGALTRSQFDIILIDHLGDIEVVELKRPDEYILSYDQNRGKFYASKDLSVAISQAERYISAVYRDNDEDYKIDGKKIKDFINSEVGDNISLETCRPTAVIIMGSFQTVSKPYAELRASTKQKVTEQHYLENSNQAYKELKNSFKNIKILTYSELLQHARTRLELSKDEDE